ncbi:MAG: hypothetical protein J1F35_08540 [Erysipelotrichales bacterium]|nr:hypothetical protein [Erysipelotrichales bacterium]
MGLDLNIYKENKRGKRNHITYFSSDGWPIVTHFENLHNQSFNNSEVKASQEYIRNIIEHCRDIIIAYFQNTFECDDKWIPLAKSLFPISNKDDKLWYDKTYIDNLFVIYEELMSIYEEMDSDETIIFEISY